MLTGDRKSKVQQAVVGLTEEDEFALLCMLMRTATHLAPLEQKISVASGSAAPDLLARFQPGFSRKGVPASHHTGYRCFVEIKSTEKQRFRIGGSTLQRLRCFANAFDLPLLFAVRFLQFNDIALWVMVEDTDRSRQSVTITLSDWIGGLRPVLWNEHSYMLLPGTYFQSTYNSKITGEYVRHSEYGEQVAFQVITHKGRFGFAGRDSTVAGAFFEPYGLEEAACQRKGEFVHVAYRARNLMLSIADIVYGMNRLPRDGKGHLLYDAARALRELADGQSTTLVDRDVVEYLGNRFCDIGALGAAEIGDTKNRHERWLSTGGQDSTS